MYAVKNAKHLIIGSLVSAAILTAASAQTQPSAVPLAVPVPASATASGASSFSGGSASIIIVDGERIIREAKASKEIQTQLDGQEQNYQKEINAKQTELEGEQTDLQRQQRTLPPDQFEEKRHAFAKKMEDVQRDVDSKKRGLQKAFVEALDKVKRALVEIVNSIAQEHRANLVLLKSATVISDPAFEVTEEALTKLNQKLPYVKVDLAGEGAGPAQKKN